MITAKEARKATDESIRIRTNTFNETISKLLDGAECLIQLAIRDMIYDQRQLACIVLNSGKTYNEVMLKVEHLEALCDRFEALGYKVESMNGNLRITW